MRRVASRIRLSDKATRDAERKRAKADFFADSAQYPCLLPPRSEAATFYDKVQRILDKETEITTLYDAYIHQSTALAANDFVMRVELAGHGLDVVGPVLDRALKKEREMRRSQCLLAPVPPLAELSVKAEASVPRDFVGTTFTFLSRNGARQTCTIHRSGHDADGEIFFVNFGTGVDIEVSVSKAKLLLLLERKVDSDLSTSPSSSSSDID
jgi:hypothetical protein